MAKIISARRVVDIPGIGSYELVNNRRSVSDYTKSTWAYACMNIRGSELAGLPWRITRNGKTLDSHPLIDMLTNFGEESNYASSIIATEIDQLLHGYAFWLRDLDVLTRLNAGTITVKANREGIQEFIQTINGEIVNRFKRDDIVYFREFNPVNDLGAGVSVIEVLKEEIALEFEASEYIKAFFKNDATPSLLLTTDQTVSQTEMNKVLLWWKSRFQGSKNAHKVAMADRGIKAQILSASLKDNAIVEVRDQARNDICVAMRVPKILVGAMEEAIYSNAQEARKFMIEDMIIPRSKHYADAINQDLIQKVDPSVVFEFDPSSLPLLQEDATAKWERLDRAIERGVISVEFARQEMGWADSAAPQGIPSAARSWKRKAINAFNRGELPDVDFETDSIAADEQLRIHDKLSKAGSIQSIVRAFIDD